MDETTPRWAPGHCYWHGSQREETMLVQIVHTASGLGGSVRACRACWEDDGDRGQAVRRQLAEAEMHERWRVEDREQAERDRAEAARVRDR